MPKAHVESIQTHRICPSCLESILVNDYIPLEQLACPELLLRLDVLSPYCIKITSLATNYWYRLEEDRLVKYCANHI